MGPFEFQGRISAGRRGFKKKKNIPAMGEEVDAARKRVGHVLLARLLRGT
jgi:hypothetical protein